MFAWTGGGGSVGGGGRGGLVKNEECRIKYL